ncbi:transcriptional regulator [Peribacillus loiseleuriae]|uniref:Transcriptional regulator n=2 Tax=Peribacillus loiseleuriae TaxID=1679170 RepID=A0A0K9H009_9BACI|nr:transcriptional regulator [Peribacillus loiseleuriae]
MNENEWVEFKVNNDEPDLIGQYLSALSNSACLHNQKFGYLIYGIDDKTREVIGTEFKPRTKKVGNQELESWLATIIAPRVDFKIFEFKYNDKDLVMFKVDATNNMPVSFKGIAYIRVGSYKKKLDEYPQKARKIWTKTSNQVFESQIALHSVDEDTVLKLLDYPSYFSLLNQNLPTDKSGILNKLEEEKMMVKSGKLYDITNLGAILFAKDLHSFEKLARKAIRVVIYKGKDRLNAKKEQVGGKGYAIGFEGLINYINDQLPTNEEIGAVFRKEVKMYPELAIREAVANAIIHQDFNEVGTGPMIEIFADRIEITNPGKPLINYLRLIDHSPQSRNEKLAYFMRRINVCEERGSGIDKIVNLSEEYQLPAPNFIEGTNSMKVIMYAYRKLSHMDKQDKIRACYQHSCLKYVSSDYMTNQTFRERLQIAQKNYSIASRIIADAIEAGLVKDYDPENKSKKYAKYVPFWA